MTEVEKMSREESKGYNALFYNAPISFFEIDSSDVKEFIEELRRDGVNDLENHFNDNTLDIIKCVSLMRITKVNQAALDLFKAKDQNEIQQGFSKIFTEDSLLPLKNQLVALANNYQIFEYENNCVDLEGTHLTVNIKVAIVDTDGKPWSRILCFVENVTWKKELKIARVDSNKKYEQLLQTADEGICIAGADDRFTYVNKKFTEITGYDDKEMIGMSIFDLFEKDKEEEIKEHLSRRFAGISEKYEIEGLKKDGTKNWVLISASPIHDEAGQIVGTLGMVTDINERKRVEKELKEKEKSLAESEQLYRMLAESSSDIIGIADKKMNFKYMNKSGCELLNIDFDNLIGMNMEDFYDKKTISVVRRSFNKAIKSRKEVKYSLRIDATGKKRWVDVCIIPIVGTKEKIDSLLITSHDITKLTDEKIYSNTLNEINAFINSSFDIKEIFKKVNPKVADILETESVAMFERVQNEWELKFHRLGDSSKLPVGHRFSDKELPIASIAARTNAAYAVEDAWEGEPLRREAMKRLGVRSALMIPLTRGAKVFGVICFCNHSKTQIFTDKQLDFSNKLSSSLSLTFENARLYEKEKNEKKLSITLNEINSAIHKGQDIEKTFDIVLQKSCEAFGCFLCALVMREGDQWVIKNICGLTKEMVGTKLSDNEARTAVIAEKTKQAVIVEDALTDDRVSIDMVKKYGIRSFVTAPLFMGDSMIGVLEFVKTDTHKFSETQIDYLNKIAASVSFALSGAQLNDKK